MSNKNEDATHFCKKCDEILIPKDDKLCIDCQVKEIAPEGWEKTFWWKMRKEMGK